MTRKETAKRYILFIICLFFMGLGVALTRHGELGVSPISSVANIVSLKFTALSFGTWLMISNCLLLLFFHGQLRGTREGTILSALLVGVTVKFFCPRLKKPLTEILTR